jgi:hypothetical protein
MVIAEAYVSVQEKARSIMKNTCRVGKVCNGSNCTGNTVTMMEMGGKGGNTAFQESYEALSRGAKDRCMLP